MEKGLTKDKAERLMGLKGEIRGMDIKADEKFVREREGKEGPRKVEELLNELGVDFHYKDFRSMAFYPAGLRALSLLAIREKFGYGEEVLEEMGRVACKRSLIIKLFVQYFGSKKDFFMKRSPFVWSRYWTKGDFTPLEFDEEKKRGRVEIRGLDLDPAYCTYLKGYFEILTRLVTGSDKIEAEETKCTFRGDESHEYTIDW